MTEAQKWSRPAAGREPAAAALLSWLADPQTPRLCVVTGSAGCVWRRVRGDIRPPWPGPARALSSGRGHLAGKLVVADHQGTVRLLDEANATPSGRLPEPVAGVRAVAAVPEGDVLILDAEGRLHTRRSPAAPRATGLAALLEDGPTPLDRLVEAARRQLDGSARALAYAEDLLAVSDATGRVHVVSETEGEPGPLTARLHEGEVAAVAALRLEMPDDAPGIPLVYSGGYDGTVRAWGPGAEPLATPVRSRPCPVTALAAASADAGPVLAVAWADGLVEHETLEEGGQVRTFWSGAPVHSLALTGAGHLLIGTDETLACLALA